MTLSDRSNLSSLLGEKSLSLHAPYFHVRNQWFLASSFSTRVRGSKKWLVLRSEWMMNSDLGSEIQYLIIEKQSGPRDITWNDAGKSGMFGFPVSSFRLAPPLSKVISISVYSTELAGLKASLRLDVGLVFHLEDHRCLLVTLNPAQELGVRCTSFLPKISSVVDTWSERLRLQ